MEETEDKYNIREILVRNKGFTPKMQQEIEKQIDLIIKVEFIKFQLED